MYINFKTVKFVVNIRVMISCTGLSKSKKIFPQKCKSLQITNIKTRDISLSDPSECQTNRKK